MDRSDRIVSSGKAHVILLSPVTPFRGGIARHSTALARAFAQMDNINIEIESFSRLYPKLLYPGESDRAASDTPPTGISTRFDLDSINPLSWRRIAKRITAQQPSLVIIPAWTFFVAPALGSIARMLRWRGTPVAMIVHNVADHDGSTWKRCLSEWQLRQADFFITQGSDLADRLKCAVTDRPIIVHPHPPYSDYPQATGQMPREFALELLCFGLVRPYKGVDIAIEALAASRRRDIRLTVAGEAWQDLEALCQLAEQRGVTANVEFIPEYVSDQTAAELFARADAVLAPYRSVTGSGVLALAHHYRRPVITSDLPGFSEHIRHGQDGWLFPVGDVRALAKLLAEMDRENAAAMGAFALADDGKQQWHNFATALLDGLKTHCADKALCLT